MSHGPGGRAETFTKTYENCGRALALEVSALLVVVILTGALPPQRRWALLASARYMLSKRRKTNIAVPHSYPAKTVSISSQEPRDCQSDVLDCQDLMVCPRRLQVGKSCVTPVGP